MTLAPGTRLGSFEIVTPLGAGGMGVVYRARDTRLARDVAIKAIPPSFAADPTRLARFRREAQMLASLNHPNIAAIYGLEDSSSEPYLVLELVEGETLAARIARGALPIPECLALHLQIGAAIEAAHERGIVHRDLKPGNIMITPAGAVKVLDFGLAKSDPAVISGSSGPDARTIPAPLEATAAGLILGTLAYMSPEQARGKAVDRRSDVWSFGCVLFECLVGHMPFEGETVSDLIASILERNPKWEELPAGTPPRLREVLRRCLRKDVDARPRDIRDVRLELAELAAGNAKLGATHEHSIAVLPFDNLSGPEDEYFADGVTEELLNTLSKLDGLRVAARTSCFAFKGKRQDLRVVGEKLDVSTVLEGSVRRAGSRLRISVQLVKAADGYQLWSERYDREMKDVFELQDEIAGAIAGRLRGAMHRDADHKRVRSGTQNLEAYELLLKGRALQSKRGRFLPQAIACFEQAIALDPNYAEAIAWLSDSYRLRGTFGTAPFSEVFPKAKQLGERALAIDPELAEAWATLAAVEEQHEWNFERGAIMWERVFAIDPRHARARSQRALWSFLRGVYSADTALTEARQAVLDDPLSAWVAAMHSSLLGWAGRHEESIVEAERSLTLDTESFFAQWNLMRGYAWAGQYDRAIELVPVLLESSGRHHWVLGMMAWVYGKMGKPEVAKAVFDELEARSRYEFLSPFWLAVAAASANLPEESLRFAERTVSERDPMAIWTRVVPFWDTIRTYPQIEALMQPAWK